MVVVWRVVLRRGEMRLVAIVSHLGELGASGRQGMLAVRQDGAAAAKIAPSDLWAPGPNVHRRSAFLWAAVVAEPIVLPACARAISFPSAMPPVFSVLLCALLLTASAKRGDFNPGLPLHSE